MENARLLTETREALEKQTATAEILRVISGSPSDVQPTFDAIAANATILTGAETGGVFRFDGSLIHFAAHYGYGADILEAIQRDFPTRPGRHSAAARAILTREVAHIPDAAADPEYALPAMLKTGVHTLLSVPILQDGNPVGVISVTRREVEPFSQAQINLLKTFADQAVIAVENVRLFNETREALEQQTATAEVLQVINASAGDLAPVFDCILGKAQVLCESGHGTLFLRDGEHFRPVAMRGVPEPIAERLRSGHVRSDVPVAQPLLAGEPLAHITDVAAIDHPMMRIATETGVRILLSVPLKKGDELFGMIVAARFEARPFSEKQIALLQNFAAQAVIAMENARLINETREALERQTATSEVLQVINSSPGELEPVFEAILEKALTLCEAAHGVLLGTDGELVKPLAARGEQAYLDFLRGRGAFPLAIAPAGTPLGDLLRGERIVHIADTKATEGYHLFPEYRALAEAADLHSLVAVGLQKDEKFLGALVIYRREVRPFADKQIALLQNFAAQAVIAMENARLLGELRQRTEEVAELNHGLEARVAAQVEELGRVSRLKRFLAPQLAEMIIAKGEEGVLESHRREIVVVFCDLRGYTAFTETAEPEDVLNFLREYHGALGPLVSQFEGTLDQFSGDGIMVFFNDPVPCPDPAERAVKMAMAMREAASKLIGPWRRRHAPELGFGVGIAQGYATLGQIGFSERSGYTAIGTVCNLAARLCAEAKDGQILVSNRVAGAVEAIVKLEDLGNLEVKGLSRPVAAFNVAETVGGLPASG
jgi:adenylate cyclase